MAEEIEKFLITKFSEGLGDGSSKVPLHSQFVELRNLLDNKLKSSLPPAELKELREKLYNLNNVLTECRMLSSNSKVFSTNGLWFLNNTRTSLNKMKRELQEANGSTLPTISTNRSLANSGSSLPKNEQYFRWSSRSVDASKIHGFEDQVILVERMLFHKKGEDTFKAMGIVGKGGIGKTTLAQLIFNKQEVKNYFLPRIWVCLSRQPNEKEDPKTEIAKRMLKYLGVEDEFIESVHQKHGLKGLIYALQLQLKGKRYLIVLDDAWDENGWYGNLGSWVSKEEEWGNQLAYGLPKGNGGRVIVTSRSEELTEKMVVGEENIFRLLPLSDPESCWLIFKDEVMRNGGDGFNPAEPEIAELKEEIIKKSAGLPLAAKTMGQIMYEQIREKLIAQTNQINHV